MCSEMACEVVGVCMAEWLCDGFEVVIIGVLNVGKSILMNWLA